jgi:hypothetical protein
LRKIIFSRGWRRRDDAPPISGSRCEIVKQIPAAYEGRLEPDPASTVEAHIRKVPGGKYSESA